ncbi:ABC transporter permease [Candidatus Woesearchaeota archaeon]|nr:ABC transporter permease [Candidatus Woesearchaeota archaeon]
MKLFKVIQKNFKLLFRSKFTSFLFLFGPLIVIMLVGFAFNNFGQYKILVGTYSDEYSTLAKDYVVELSASNFRITKYSSEEECVNEIKYGGVHTCLVFPRNFDVLTGNSTLKFYVDPSNSNLVWMVVDEVSKKIKTSSSKVQLNITQDIIGRVEASSTMASDVSALLVQISTNNDAVSTGIVQSSNLANDLDLGVDDVPKASSISTITTSSNLDDLLEKALDSVTETEDLVDSIKDSTTWDTIANKTELTSILNSAESSAATLRTSINTKYNGTRDSLVGITQSLYSLDSDLDQIENLLSSVQETREDLLVSLGKIKSDVASIKSDLTLAIDKVSLIKSTLSGMSVKDAGSIVTPITTEVIEITNDDEESHVNFFFPALIILMIMFVGLLLSALNIVMEKNSRAYFRNFITPTGDSLFLFSGFFTNFIILSVELLIILSVTYLAFDSTILENIGITILVLVMTSTFFIILGMIIGYLFKSEEAAILGTISLSCIFFFISNLILPLDALPDEIKFLVGFNPFIIANNLLRRSLLFNTGFLVMYEDLLLFGLYILGAIVLLYAMQKIMKLKFFYHNSLKNKKVNDVVELEDANTTLDDKAEKKSKKTNKKEAKVEPAKESQDGKEVASK